EIPSAESFGENDAPAATAAENSHEAEELESEMPYLFQPKNSAPSAAAASDPALAFAQPLGDAIVPGGAAEKPDLETLKRYLLLREQDVAVLSTQLKAAQEQIASLEKQIRDRKSENVELTHVIGEQKRRIDEHEKDKTLALETLQRDADELRFELKAKN